MDLASQDDIEKALRRELTDSEAESVDGLAETASDLVVGYLFPCPIPDPTPPAIVRVVADMVAAVLNRPPTQLPDTQSLNAGIFGVNLTPGSTSQGPYLTAAFKQRLKPFRCGNGMVSVQLGSERY